MIAITGGAGEGKSTVLSFLADRGFTVASADQIVADMWSTPLFLAEVQRELAMAQIPTRDTVRDQIITDISKRRKLNKLVHSQVFSQILEKNPEFVEIPLLVETASFQKFSEIWVVTCGPSEQFRRLADRLKSEENAQKLISAQLPSAIKITFADEIIRTNVPFADVSRQIVESLARR